MDADVPTRMNIGWGTPSQNRWWPVMVSAGFVAGARGDHRPARCAAAHTHGGWLPEKKAGELSCGRGHAAANGRRGGSPAWWIGGRTNHTAGRFVRSECWMRWRKPPMVIVRAV